MGVSLKIYYEKLHAIYQAYLIIYFPLCIVELHYISVRLDKLQITKNSNVQGPFVYGWKNTKLEVL